MKTKFYSIRALVVISIGLMVVLAFDSLRAGPQGESNGISAPRFDAWRILGPGGGGAQFFPAVSPHDPNLVLVACDMTGAYISHDGGNSWRMFSLRSPARFFEFDPQDPKVIYTGASALWRSADTGQTWSLVFPAPESVTGLDMPDDHASPDVLTAGGPAEPVAALAVDPTDSKTLFLAAGRQGRASIYISNDAGAHWAADSTAPGGLAAGIRKIFVDPRSPQSNRTLYVIGRNGVAIRTNGKWEQHAPPAAGAEISDASAGFSPDGTLIVYALAGERSVRGSSKIRIYVSHDAGQSWEDSTPAMLRLGDSSAPVPVFNGVAASFGHSEVAYLSFEDFRTGPDAKSVVHGVARTIDTGRTWSLMWNEGDAPAANVHDAWITEGLGTDWGEPGESIAASPTNPDLCYRTDLGRTMRTTDGGKTWDAVYSKRMPDHTYVSTGLDVTTNYGVFFDPFDSKRMFIAYTDIGLFRSENGGESWALSINGIPRRWINTTYWLVFDPEVKGRVWGVMSQTHDLPRPKMWRRTPPSRFAGGVCISEDGGRTWRASNAGMPQTAATHILLDPTSPAQARVLYATGFGKGVFKSVDGGKTWALKNNGLPGTEPFAWRLARDKQGTLYLVVARRSEVGNFGNAEDGALYRSTDGAENWTRVQLPEGVNGPNGIAIDPTDVNRLYITAWRRNSPRATISGGIFVSPDGGKTWKNTLDRDQHVYDVTVDPRDTRTVYACGFESSAWRSNDRGETWQRIRGYNFKWGHRVMPDPFHPEMIYVMTFGGSVWYGPAMGDPNAVEDIVSPVLSYHK